MNLEPSSLNRMATFWVLVLCLLLPIVLVGCGAPTSVGEGAIEPDAGSTTVPVTREVFTASDESRQSAVNGVSDDEDSVAGSDVEEIKNEQSADIRSDEPAHSTASPTEILPAIPDTSNGRPLEDTTNILLLGSDRRPDTPNWRTDVMMIIALDRETGRAGVISIPRDLFIEDIPNHKPNRVNVVDYLGELEQPNGGGPDLLAGIIERNMGILIHHYLRFSFDSFREVVDALDGVPVDIDCEFQGFIEEEGGWLVLEPGMHRLTGHQAMIYVRDRQLTGGDLNRARRQQRFIWAVRNQVLDENLVKRIPSLYTAMSGSVDTDIGLVTALQLARLALALDPEDLYGMVLAPPDMLEEGWALGMSVFLPNWDLIAQNVQLVFDNPPFMIANTPEDCR